MRDLLAVVETGSLRGAARRLGLTQPSLTKSLRHLEEQAGIPLLVRSKYGVTLTTAGERLVGHARSIEAEMLRTAQDLELLRGRAGNSISIGVSVSAALDFVARAVERVHAGNPGLQIQIFEGVHEQLAADVRLGVVDFVIMPVGDRSQLAGLRIRPIFETRVVAVGRNGHPGRGARTLAELGRYDWITPRRGGTLDGLVKQAIAEAGIPPFRRPVQCDSAAIYLEVIAGSDLIGLSLNAMVCSRLMQNMGLQVLFDGPPLPALPIALVHRPDFPHNALALALADCCRVEGAAYVGRT